MFLQVRQLAGITRRGARTPTTAGTQAASDWSVSTGRRKPMSLAALVTAATQSASSIFRSRLSRIRSTTSSTINDVALSAELHER